MKLLKYLFIFWGVGTWPLNLFRANTLPDFLKYIFPLFEPKLVSLPLIASLIYFFTTKNKKLATTFIVLSFITLWLNWKDFFGQTIFKYDYERRQEIIRKTYLYPSVVLARIYQNKVKIYINKFSSNFFALTDPNNYFFGFHPREIPIENQNLTKFPFLTLPFMLVGLYFLPLHKNKKFIIIFLSSSIISLSLLSSFDRHDLILWLPLSLIFIHGVDIVDKKYLKK